ncbi:MAG: DUF4397 domain-containing protein [Gammaproteobacteria bacterium]|nr:DUF4397 domain-containing protein [Gammaproteobacteria bacterium]
MSVFYRFIVLLALSSILISCAKSERKEATGKGAIRGYNALSESFNVNFLIEERSLGVLDYKEGSAVSRFDDLTYSFNFDIAFAGAGAPQRIASVSADVVTNTDYVFLLAGTVATPEILVWERPEREWTDTETVFEMAFGHLSPALGSVDVYYAATGTAPVLGNAIGTIAFGERIDELEFEAGQYELILTAPGDPSNVLFQGSPLTNPAAATNASLILDRDPSRTGDVAVRQLIPSGSSIEIPDARFLPTVQVINAAFGSGNVDLVINNDFVNPPAITDLAFGMASADVVVPAGTLPYTYTPPASTTALLEEETGIGLGTRTMIILRGEPGALATSKLASNRRPIATSAQFRIANAAFNFPAVDVYLSNDDTLLDDLLPILRSLPFGLASEYQLPVADSYTLTVTTANEKTVLAGPLTLELAIGDIEEIVLLDTADPTIGSLLQFTNLPTP